MRVLDDAHHRPPGLLAEVPLMSAFSPSHDPRVPEELSRRDFVRLCTIAAAAVGLGPFAAETFVDAAARGQKPSVI